MKTQMWLSLILVIGILAVGVFGQDPPPPPAVPSVPDAPKLRNDSIRQRSIDLERTKRDAARKNENNTVMKSDLDKKFPQIKEDFEGIQTSQAAIVKAYTTSETIDYSLIESSAQAIELHAKRLHGNLFESKKKKKKKKKGEKAVDDQEEKKPTGVRELIVLLDNAIGSFATSKMFQNLRVVEPAVAEKAEKDLLEIHQRSRELSKAASLKK